MPTTRVEWLEVSDHVRRVADQVNGLPNPRVDLFGSLHTIRRRQAFAALVSHDIGYRCTEGLIPQGIYVRVFYRRFFRRRGRWIIIILASERYPRLVAWRQHGQDQCHMPDWAVLAYLALGPVVRVYGWLRRRSA